MSFRYCFYCNKLLANVFEEACHVPYCSTNPENKTKQKKKGTEKCRPTYPYTFNGHFVHITSEKQLAIHMAKN